jgi:hypothetical protein
MNYNPYQAPTNPFPQSAEGQMSQGAARELLGSQGWVRFVSVLMLIGTGFMLLSVLVAVLAPTPRYPDFDGFGGRRSTALTDSRVFVQVVMFLVVGVLYLYPSILLAKYASAIKRFRYSGSMTDVEAALRHQRFFWRFVGIIGILILSLMVLMIVVGASGVLFRYGRF